MKIHLLIKELNMLNDDVYYELLQREQYEESVQD